MGSLPRLLLLAFVVAGLFYLAQEKDLLPGKGKELTPPSCVPEKPKREAAPAPDPGAAEPSAFWTVREGGAALRGGAGASHSPFADLPPDALVKELARKPGWVFVQTEDGKRGWIDAGNLAPAKPRAPR